MTLIAPSLSLSSSISEISLTVAEEGRPTKESEKAHQIEKCDCPLGYSGFSCEVGFQTPVAPGGGEGALGLAEWRTRRPLSAPSASSEERTGGHTLSAGLVQAAPCWSKCTSHQCAKYTRVP